MVDLQAASGDAAGAAGERRGSDGSIGMEETCTGIGGGGNGVEKDGGTGNKGKVSIHDLFVEPETLQWLKGKGCVESSTSSRTPIGRLESWQTDNVPPTSGTRVTGGPIFGEEGDSG